MVRTNQPGSAPAALIDVTKRYGNVVALDRLSLSIDRGRVTAVLGPNGAGKTTAVRLMLGAQRPTSGRVELFGRSPADAESRMRVGAMLQVAKVPETLRVAEHVALFSSYYPKRVPLDEVLEVVGLAGLADRAYGKLSGGEQRRLAFALALCGDPEMLVLDEPTVGMDVEARRSFWERVRALADDGRTILLTTHYLEEADALADRIVVLNHGRIVADGSAGEIKARVTARRIRCRSRLGLDEIRRLDRVELARSDRQALEIFTSSPESVVRELLARDPTLTDLEVTSAALEDAFLALTRGAA
ncbi:MAG TPA: ABC transporter ATP-binding protein [Candidatus Polarisedimenticolaceae bacterium]|nr:ABC transporter ATP-binding protein [Candidatus Polarisedimenticolaceae bacterium]